MLNRKVLWICKVLDVEEFLRGIPPCAALERPGRSFRLHPAREAGFSPLGLGKTDLYNYTYLYILYFRLTNKYILCCQLKSNIEKNI